MEVALHKVTKNDFISTDQRDLEAIGQFVDDPELWENLISLLEPQDGQWRPSFHALTILSFLSKTPQCRRWAKARWGDISVRLENLKSFTHDDDKRVASLVIKKATSLYAELEEAVLVFDEESDDDAEICIVTPLGSSRDLGRATDVDVELGQLDNVRQDHRLDDVGEDHQLLEMLEEEVWPPPSWNKPNTIGRGTESPKTTPPKRKESRRSTEPDLDMRVQVNSWRRTFKFWCCCLHSLLGLRDN